MAHLSSNKFTSVSTVIGPSVPEGLVGREDSLDGYPSGPANRALAELTLALSAGAIDADGQDGARWPTGRTIRFILVTCGLFWLAAAAGAIRLL